MILYYATTLGLTPHSKVFEHFMSLQGDIFRQQKGRITQRISLNGKVYFIKQHHGVGWKEIFKNLISFRLPVISARQEWLAINACRQVGITVPNVIAFGQKGYSPATLKSFILLEALSPVLSLETLTNQWKDNPPTPYFKYQLIKKVASIASTLHQNRINHRDFYLCHFLLTIPFQSSSPLYLIDLHRASKHIYLRKRWIIKDLAGLYFSSKNIGLTTRDLYRFIKTYTKLPLRNVFNTQFFFWQKVKKRGEQLYDEHQ